MGSTNEKWCYQKIEMLEAVIKQAIKYNSKLMKQAIKKVEDTNKYQEDMFWNIGIED